MVGVASAGRTGFGDAFALALSTAANDALKTFKELEGIKASAKNIAQLTGMPEADMAPMVEFGKAGVLSGGDPMAVQQMMFKIGMTNMETRLRKEAGDLDFKRDVFIEGFRARNRALTRETSSKEEDPFAMPSQTSSVNPALFDVSVPDGLVESTPDVADAVATSGNPGVPDANLGIPDPAAGTESPESPLPAVAAPTAAVEPAASATTPAASPGTWKFASPFEAMNSFNTDVRKAVEERVRSGGIANSEAYDIMANWMARNDVPQERYGAYKKLVDETIATTGRQQSTSLLNKSRQQAMDIRKRKEAEDKSYPSGVPASREFRGLGEAEVIRHEIAGILGLSDASLIKDADSLEAVAEQVANGYVARGDEEGARRILSEIARVKGKAADLRSNLESVRENAESIKKEATPEAKRLLDKRVDVTRDSLMLLEGEVPEDLRPENFPRFSEDAAAGSGAKPTSASAPAKPDYTGLEERVAKGMKRPNVLESLKTPDNPKIVDGWDKVDGKKLVLKDADSGETTPSFFSDGTKIRIAGVDGMETTLSSSGRVLGQISQGGFDSTSSLLATGKQQHKLAESLIKKYGGVAYVRTGQGGGGGGTEEERDIAYVRLEGLPGKPWLHEVLAASGGFRQNTVFSDSPFGEPETQMRKRAQEASLRGYFFKQKEAQNPAVSPAKASSSAPSAPPSLGLPSAIMRK
jgi:hypothetical protein